MMSNRIEQTAIASVAPATPVTPRKPAQSALGVCAAEGARVELDEHSPVVQGFLKETPLARIITVDGCADVAVFLGSDMSSSIAGHVIPVDDGNNLCRLPRWSPPRRRRSRTASLE